MFQSLEESWINGQEITRTNFVLFPLGACKIVVKKLKHSVNESQKRVISVQCSIKGLIFDVDSVRLTTFLIPCLDAYYS